MITRKNLIKLAQPVIDLALKEDIAEGDITTEAIVPAHVEAQAVLRAKENGVIAGLPVAKAVFDTIKKDAVSWHFLKDDGDAVAKGEIIAELKGNYKVLLTGERTALNYLQRMSGVATMTSKFYRQLEGTNANLLDTRKTVPCLRLLDKYAVKVGGGKNHRIGLFDMVLIKDNHIRIAGGIYQAVKSVRDNYGNKYKIEIETSNLNEVAEALDCGVDIIMLDNMSIREMEKAVNMIGNKVKTEASGNVNLKNVRKIAQTGVNYISVGAVTHSVKALDVNLKII